MRKTVCAFPALILGLLSVLVMLSGGLVYLVGLVAWGIAQRAAFGIAFVADWMVGKRV